METNHSYLSIDKDWTIPPEHRPPEDIETLSEIQDCALELRDMLANNLEALLLLDKIAKLSRFELGIPNEQNAQTQAA